MREWTVDQKKAIELGTNLLVNAAAGSGKTAVLVERIIRKLIPNEKGEYIGIDNLLVVTFARDAASEMQERVKASLKECLKNEKDKKIKKILSSQIKKLTFADITTIDAFCMRMVKQYFHILGIDPKFSIIDPAEADIFVSDALSEYFDSLYEEKNEYFFKLIDEFCLGFTDDALLGIIYDIYSFTRSLPSPNEWLSEHSKDYISFSESPFCGTLIEKAKAEVQEAIDSLKELELTYLSATGTSNPTEADSFGKISFYSYLEADIKLLSSLSNTWDGYYFAKDKLEKIAKAGGKASEEYALQKQFIDYREEALSCVRSVFSEFIDTEENLNKIYEEKLYPIAEAIKNIVLGFGEFLKAKKDKKRIYEFNDLEHMTIWLLREKEEIRESLKKKYKEILMDEYQDTNGLQEEIFSLISTGDNRFIVGDLKQSIYRFRQSDPTIFRDKDEEYRGDETKGKRVVLSKNFRSREDVLSGINYLFDKIMTKNVGGVDYDDDQALHYGNHRYDEKSKSNIYTSELYVLEGQAPADDEEEESLEDVELEASFVAKKINEMLESGFEVFEDGKFRRAVPEDFAILMNSVKSTSAYYIDALRAFDIDSFSEDDGFFDKTEIIILLELIKTVNNPFRDIPLVSVMRSPVFMFTDEELSLIRLAKKGAFWDAVLARQKEADSLGEKCKAFAEKINSWREMSRYLSADRLIWRMMTESTMYDMCGILYGGEVALANLRLFMERARLLSENGIATLFDFEKHIVKMVGGKGYKSADIAHGGVQIMTIHKSKGLEFPIVFVCGMGRKFVSDDLGKAIYLHNEYGFGLDIINNVEGYKIPSINKKLIKDKKKQEGASEQLRKLYVALTRAKEKLIVTSVVPHKQDKKTSEITTFSFADNEINESYIKGSKSFIETIAPVIKRAPRELWCYEEKRYEKPTEELLEEEIQIESEEDSEDIRAEVYKKLDRYAFAEEPALVPTKLSVSDLKNKKGFSNKLQRLPSFMDAPEQRGASYGTSIHNIMEKISITNEMPASYIGCEIERITGERNESAEEKIRGFFESPLGRRVRGAKTVVREEAFEIEIPAREVNPLAEEDEKTLLQGVIDLYFEEDGEIVLVDYKTDKCTDISELSDKYAVQLKWYRYAIEKILKQRVSGVFIYSFHKEDYLDLTERTKV